MLLINNTDISDIALNVTYQSSWNNGAGQLTFDYPASKAGMFPNGSTVIFTYGGANIFYGFLFTTKQDTKKFSCVCYDQLRYFKAKNTIIRPLSTLTEFMNTVAAAIGDRVRLGQIDSTIAKLPLYRFNNQTHLDMIYKSIEETLCTNGHWYVLRDNFGAIELRDFVDLRLPILIGDGSMATGFDYERSIDEDSYNYIKVAKDDSKTGICNTYVAMDAGNIKSWGKLILLDKVSADLNESQLAARAHQLLQLKNRETQTLKIDCMGDPRVLGGSGIRVKIAEAGLDLWTVVDSVTHNFSHNKHTMNLELKFVW
ncbi:XkdQ/YqbQ family protein [Faecalispora anaeroviscerum]|uniref:XkdQ/YqbQ family protein n=1 Tax=Faecalispora anaeroviscerum TaxID=2991836 RepID=UPI0024B8FD63|nr:hypothetical protein [Faecalispora anaeroviscerum]